MILPPQPKPAKPSFPLDVLARLPLAEAFYSLWHYLTSHDILQPLYQQHRGNGYQQQLSLFQASLCLVMYNVLQVLRSYAAASAPEPVAVARVSMAKLFDDVHEDLVALHEVLRVEEISGLFRGCARRSEGCRSGWGRCWAGRGRRTG